MLKQRDSCSYTFIVFIDARLINLFNEFNLMFLTIHVIPVNLSNLWLKNVNILRIWVLENGKSVWLNQVQLCC